MTNELAVKQMCLYLRNGVEIWIDESKATLLSEDLIREQSRKFIKIEEQLINIVEIVGIFKPLAIEELKRRKTGQWKCNKGTWHIKSDEYCDCRNVVKKNIEELHVDLPTQTSEERKEMLERAEIALKEMRSKFGSKSNPLHS